MLTDSDIDKLEKRLEKKFTTKVDLKNLVTKKDLEQFATKEDLKNFATHDDLARLRTDVRRVEGSLWLKFELLSRELAQFREEFKEFKHKVYVHLDGFAGVVKRIDEEHKGLSFQYGELRDKVDKLSGTSS